MNYAVFERAQTAAFAYREARHTGSLDCMRAICFIIRNRVKSAWGDGTWLSVIAGSYMSSAGFEIFTPGELSAIAGEPSMQNPVGLTSTFKSDDRLLQLIIRDVDDIYLSQDRFDDSVRTICCEGGSGGDSSGVNLRTGSAKKDWSPVLYYSFVDRTPRPWFVENIVRRTKEHPQVGQIGKMLLYR